MPLQVHLRNKLKLLTGLVFGAAFLSALIPRKSVKSCAYNLRTSNGRRDFVNHVLDVYRNELGTRYVEFTGLTFQYQMYVGIACRSQNSRTVYVDFLINPKATTIEAHTDVSRDAKVYSKKTTFPTSEITGTEALSWVSNIVDSYVGTLTLIKGDIQPLREYELTHPSELLVVNPEAVIKAKALEQVSKAFDAGCRRNNQ